MVKVNLNEKKKSFFGLFVLSEHILIILLISHRIHPLLNTSIDKRHQRSRMHLSHRSEASFELRYQIMIWNKQSLTCLMTR